MLVHSTPGTTSLANASPQPPREAIVESPTRTIRSTAAVVAVVAGSLAAAVRFAERSTTPLRAAQTRRSGFMGAVIVTLTARSKQLAHPCRSQSVARVKPRNSAQIAVLGRG